MAPPRNRHLRQPDSHADRPEDPHCQSPSELVPIGMPVDRKAGGHVALVQAGN